MPFQISCMYLISQESWRTEYRDYAPVSQMQKPEHRDGEGSAPSHTAKEGGFGLQAPRDTLALNFLANTLELETGLCGFHGLTWGLNQLPASVPE